MSYILKALKKSEAERAKGTVPRLTPQVTPATRTRSAVWPWVIGTALVVNATVVGFAAWGPEVQLLQSAGLQSREAGIAGPSAPVDDATAVTVASPSAPANGSHSASVQTAGLEPKPNAQGPESEAPAAGIQAPEARPAAQLQMRPPQTSTSRQAGLAAQQQVRKRQSAVQRQDSDQSAVDQPPKVRQQQAAAPPRAQNPDPTVRPPTAPSPASAQPPTRSVAPDQADTQTQADASGSAAAEQAAGMPSVRADNGTTSSPDTLPEPAASVAVAPTPARKPSEALSHSAERQVLGDPLPLGGAQRLAKDRRSDLALANPAPAPPKVEPEAEPEPEPDPYAEVPMLWQLPSAIRSSLPELSISVHVYSPESAGRFVIVDRSKYREGDVMTGGARLEAIVADGVVLEYRGRRYRIGN